MIPCFLYNGCGNDFFIFDDRKKALPAYSPSRLYHLAATSFHHFPDGLIIINRSLTSDACMRYFNRDGSAASMCGNGLRCVARYLFDEGEPCGSLEASNQKYAIQKVEEQISVDMGIPQLLETEIELIHNNTPWILHLVDTGVPHLVTIVPQMGDITSIGRSFRFHPRFAPRGVNVNFVTLTPTAGHHALVRTFERGVEAETKACGTGVTACASILHAFHNMPRQLTIQTASKECLYVRYEKENIWLQGPAICIGKEMIHVH